MLSSVAFIKDANCTARERKRKVVCEVGSNLLMSKAVLLRLVLEDVHFHLVLMLCGVRCSVTNTFVLKEMYHVGVILCFQAKNRWKSQT